ncbi:SIR2 family protein [Pectobacterium aroidearum]|uniref:SIR2 family protein n=1 Tax=Pectobacterium aroidearum TaxID=1201031 RepID=A0ABR5ZF27_9GAMM|nr:MULTISPECIES: SIR2 family protein [Pectobacterium]MBA5200346.1 SIR2 family protein [Pectobacterium aroidearum]MBA5228778.1 SIR2 family protein [Pectobacterium aroidearum]MBA5233181.1 SIR2 family protein [Pectobacterium aroidearum]MBA5738300.1 SIR2 family protein [Pectobacterium aroidearum]UXK01230.1 SIR2 family protein [Pectobacterium aroidearum]
MQIDEFFSSYKNHPILFVGAGFSIRYLFGSYSWSSLLEKVTRDLTGSNELFIDLRKKYNNEQFGVDYSSVAEDIEEFFEQELMKDRTGKFKEINDEYYHLAETDFSISRFKIYLTKLVDITSYKSTPEELEALSNASRNIASVITTNYDRFIEGTLGFKTVIGNDILLSNPYGSVYKIHGCITKPSSIIITKRDYKNFNTKYELIRAQLLSLFIHNPIIFIGYSIGDSNIKNVLKTIFSYVPKDSKIAEQIRNNFLLVEWSPGVDDMSVITHDIEIEDIGIIKINKVITDNFIELYKSISKLKLPVSVMDIRKVEDVFRKIKEGGDIKVKLVGDIDSLSNDEMVLAVGSTRIIKYHFQTLSEMMENYFDIIENNNKELIELLEKQVITSRNHIPAHGFDRICPGMNSMVNYKKNQIKNLNSSYRKLPDNCRVEERSIEEIFQNHGNSPTKINNIIFYNFHNDNIKASTIKDYLLSFKNKKTTDYRKLLSLYDFKIHSKIT